jgi:hypothetical protein
MGFPQLRWEEVRCKHLYLYLDHQDYGFCNLRIQTWFPYQIQIALNGREWLRRQLDKAGIAYQRSGNKFLELANGGLSHFSQSPTRPGPGRPS